MWARKLSAGVIKVVDLLLRCFAVVVPQQPAQSFATDNVAISPADVGALDRHKVAQRQATHISDCVELKGALWAEISGRK